MDNKETTWNLLVSGNKLEEEAKARSETKIFKKDIKKDEIDQYTKDNWEIEREYKNGTFKISKEKSIGDRFENEVWLILKKMGFTTMNATNQFKILTAPATTKQIDIIAIDDEVCLFVECKATETYDNSHSWKNVLDEINGYKQGAIKEIRSKYPGLKIGFIFATYNYVINDDNKTQMKNHKIANFEYDVITYYSQLVEHLGTAAKFQLLGNLFANQKIKNVLSEVPAIKGNMGGKTYYSFSIEPSRLLKIAFVLHRTNANNELLPTYQRLIKKDRLTAIRKYINDGGYFPNSIIIAFDSKNLQFDQASMKTGDENTTFKHSKIGILHLPQTYQSAYIIDGQHRLYGYSESNYADNNAVPVIAFEDLDKEEQLKMFMDINQNQKQVSASLKNTLSIDLLWNSDSKMEQRKALILYIIQCLGERSNSPLFKRIVTGENKETTIKCITLEQMRIALDKSDFFNRYKTTKNNTIISNGTFDKNENKKTADLILPFLCKSLAVIQRECSVEWNKGKNGYITINNCMHAIIRVINDIVNIKLKETNRDSVFNIDFYRNCEPLITDLAKTLNSLTDEEISNIKTARGGNAGQEAWNTLRLALHNNQPEYTYEELENYISEYATDYSLDAKDRIQELVKTIKSKLINKLEDNWMTTRIDESTATNIVTKKAQIEFEKSKADGVQQSEVSISYWDVVGIDEILSLLQYKNNWSSLFQTEMVIADISNTKSSTIEWLSKINVTLKKIDNSKHITKSEYEYIVTYYNAFCNNNITISND